MSRGVIRGTQLLGQHSQGPRIWRVYSRKKRGTRGNQQVEETVMHSGEVVGAKARIENGRGGENETITKEKEEQTEFRGLVAKFLKDQGRRITQGGEEGSEFHGSHDPRGEQENDAHIVAKRVELPSFEGSDPRGWLTRAETYFQIHQTRPEMRILMAQVCMEGQVVHWFTILLEVYPEISWEQFKREFVERFSGLDIQNPYEELAALRQKGTVQEYIAEFEYLLALVPQQPKLQYVGYFLNGLNEDIQNWVRVHNPETRIQDMKLARNVEVALKKAGERQLIGRMGLNQDYKGPNLMGHLKYGTNCHKKPGVSAVLGANDDKYVGGAAGNMRSEASFKRGTHNLTTKEWE
ncbi:Retrotransposon gag domain [Sesbania bispinosa]|nr:Retrotransposon gag domain [Sesbania bispinosa]